MLKLDFNFLSNWHLTPGRVLSHSISIRCAEISMHHVESETSPSHWIMSGSARSRPIMQIVRICPINHDKDQKFRPIDHMKIPSTAPGPWFAVDCTSKGSEACAGPHACLGRAPMLTCASGWAGPISHFRLGFGLLFMGFISMDLFQAESRHFFSTGPTPDGH